MLFNFELFALEDVAPWTTPAHGNTQSLSWFGLTQGWYWIDTGAGELFRYSDKLRQHWAQSYPDTIDHPCVDYFVVRLWEDILEMLPTILEPAPEDLAAYIRPGGRWGSWNAWARWSDRAHDWMETPPGAANWELFYDTNYWWWSRKLDTAYLKASPGIWFWREADKIHIQWDNKDILLEDVVAWSTDAGEVSISVSDFLAEVQSFDERLMRAMAERVDTVRHNWSRPEVQIDWQKLRTEHHQRTAKLAKVLAQSPSQTDWNQVRTALAAMERHQAEMTPTNDTG